MNTFNDNIISWLLEENNPAAAYRTKTELLEQPASKTDAAEWIYSFIQMTGIKQRAYGIGIMLLRQLNVV